MKYVHGATGVMYSVLIPFCYKNVVNFNMNLYEFISTLRSISISQFSESFIDRIISRLILMCCVKIGHFSNDFAYK